MFATTKKVKIGDEEIVCMDLTYGYIVGVDDGTIEDNLLTAVENGTALDMDKILTFRRSEVEGLYHTIMKLTYPHLYDNDGNMKQDVVEEISKKKASNT